MAWQKPCRLAAFLAYVAQQVGSSTSPIIGIFSLPTGPYLGTSIEDPCQGDHACEVLPASYVRFIEAAGGRVVPVSYNASDDQIDHLVESLNGFLFTGGADIVVPRAAHRVLEHSKLLHRAGQPGRMLPVWATCLGFEWMVSHIAEDCLENDFSASNVSFPLHLTEEVAGSRLLGTAPPSTIEAMTKHNTTFNFHHRGVSPDRWQRFPALAMTLKVLSTNIDLTGKAFVSTVEGQNGLPWYGVQWHPEKNTFEHGLSEDGTPFEAIPHSTEAVVVQQYVANFFVNEARQSTQRFANVADEAKHLIYGRGTSRAFSPGFDEVYVLRYPEYEVSHGGAVTGARTPQLFHPTPAESTGGRMSDAPGVILA